MERNNFQSKSLTEAFRVDCQTLITRFELSYNINFQNFCEIWRDMRFSLIFVYFPTEAFLTTFCEKALCISKQFLVNGSSLKERIGALYLLYGVYYKIPVNNLKIRMTLSDWYCLMELHHELKTEEYLDANYILCKLFVENAFIHCISDSEYGIEREILKNYEKPSLDVNLMPDVKKLAEPDGLFSTISKLSKIYEEEKNVLYEAEDDSGLQLYDSKMADDIIKKIRTVQSQSSIFVKSNTGITGNAKPAPSASSVNQETSQKPQKRARFRKRIILSKIGRGFEKGLHSESEEEQSDPETNTRNVKEVQC